MSSPDSDPDEGRPPASQWGLWRKLMLAGALVLLANALVEALMNPDPPRAISVIAQTIGFVLLAAGFGQRMRDRRGS